MVDEVVVVPSAAVGAVEVAFLPAEVEEVEEALPEEDEAEVDNRSYAIIDDTCFLLSTSSSSFIFLELSTCQKGSLVATTGAEPSAAAVAGCSSFAAVAYPVAEAAFVVVAFLAFEASFLDFVQTVLAAAVAGCSSCLVVVAAAEDNPFAFVDFPSSAAGTACPVRVASLAAGEPAFAAFLVLPAASC